MNGYDAALFQLKQSLEILGSVREKGNNNQNQFFRSIYHLRNALVHGVAILDSPPARAMIATFIELYIPKLIQVLNNVDTLSQVFEHYIEKLNNINFEHYDKKNKPAALNAILILAEIAKQIKDYIPDKFSEVCENGTFILSLAGQVRNDLAHGKLDAMPINDIKDIQSALRQQLSSGPVSREFTKGFAQAAGQFLASEAVSSDPSTDLESHLFTYSTYTTDYIHK